MVTPAHAPVARQFLEDLAACVSSLRRGEPAPEGSAAMYGMVGAVPDRAQLDGFLVEFLDGLFPRA
jgi:hypothetical protein